MSLSSVAYDLLKTLSCLSQPKCSEVVDVVCKYLPHHADHFADVQKKRILESASCAMCLCQDGEIVYLSVN